MFSLIIVLTSIALVVALVAATIYYGGDSSAKAAALASASTLINQASQINAAGTIAVSQGSDWPAASPAFSAPYLTSMPVPPRSAYADSTATPAATDWAYYLPAAHHFVLQDKINRDVCLAVNKKQGFIGIPAVWDGVSLIQCFGPGVSAQAGAAPGYTFFYDPLGSTPAQDAAALEQSKVEGSSTVAGYPRFCPDGTTITTGTCVDTASSTPPAPPAAPPTGPGAYHLTAIPGVLNTAGVDPYADNFMSYCSPDTPAGVITESSVITIGGTAVAMDAFYEYDNQQCIDVATNPAKPAGAVPVHVSNTDGSTIDGTVEYVTDFASAPTVDATFPIFVPYDKSSTIILTGENFQPGVTVFIDWARAASTTYIDSTHLQLTIPPASTLGVDVRRGSEYTMSLMVKNPGSDYDNSGEFTYLRDDGPSNKIAGQTFIYPNTAYTDGSTIGDGVQQYAYICADNYSSALLDGAGDTVYVKWNTERPSRYQNSPLSEYGSYTVGSIYLAALKCRVVAIPPAAAEGPVTVAVHIVNHTGDGGPDTEYTTTFNYTNAAARGTFWSYPAALDTEAWDDVTAGQLALLCSNDWPWNTSMKYAFSGAEPARYDPTLGYMLVLDGKRQYFSPTSVVPNPFGAGSCVYTAGLVHAQGPAAARIVAPDGSYLSGTLNFAPLAPGETFYSGTQEEAKAFWDALGSVNY